MITLYSNFNSTLDSFVDALESSLFYQNRGLTPNYNYKYSTNRVRSEGDKLICEFDLPGYAPEELSITIEDNTLKISSEKEGRKFTQKYSLSKEYDPTTAESEMKHGVLTLSLTRHKKYKPINVQIKR